MDPIVETWVLAPDALGEQVAAPWVCELTGQLSPLVEAKPLKLEIWL